MSLFYFQYTKEKKKKEKETLKYRSYTVYYIKFQVYNIWVKKKKKSKIFKSRPRKKVYECLRGEELKKRKKKKKIVRNEIVMKTFLDSVRI